MTATIPSEWLATDSIYDMTPGSSAWTVPWALMVGSDMNSWLRPDFTVRSMPGGTVTMLVERRFDGYHVHRPRGATWRTTPFLQPELQGLIPVAGFHEADS